MAEGEIPPQATNGSRSHSSLPSLKAGLFISLSVIFMIKPSFISLTSQILTLLVEVMKTNHGLRLVLLLVFVTVFVFLTSNINRNENASSNDNNDEHEWISSNFSSYPDDDDDDLLYHYYQQREDQVHEERRESNFQPKTPTSLLPVRPPVSAGTKENKEHTQKSIHTILNPQKPSSTAAQKPPSPDEEVMRSNRVDQHVGAQVLLHHHHKLVPAGNLCRHLKEPVGVVVRMRKRAQVVTHHRLVHFYNHHHHPLSKYGHRSIHSMLGYRVIIVQAVIHQTQ